MTTIFQAATAADFLALVPRLAGFSPTRSLVLVPFAGNRTLGVMRLDLPDDHDDVERFASTFVGLVCRIATADALAPVVYTDATFGETDGLPHDRLMSALLTRADICGLEVRDALCVAADGWGSYLDPTCPDEGRALAELRLDRAELTELPLRSGDQTGGAALPLVDLVEKERVGRALHDLSHAVSMLRHETWADPDSPDDPARVDPRALAAAEALDDLPLLLEDALDWDPAGLDPFQAAALGWSLMRPALRDIALTQWCRDLDAGDEAAEAQVRWQEGEEYPAALASSMWGEGPRPDPDRLARALELARRVAVVMPRADRPGALAACAWLSWASGRSTHAAGYAEAALAIEPEHGLSQIVMTFVTNAHLPEWVFERPVPRGTLTRVI
ncbi:DUF4192 family protein [Microbacterium sp. P06]|uniref:DUF4192 family protein n=1 Tax=Microbacterium sp. P06 TaxID=3366949 RepID=UPI003745007A